MKRALKSRKTWATAGAILVLLVSIVAPEYEAEAARIAEKAVTIGVVLGGALWAADRDRKDKDGK